MKRLIPILLAFALVLSVFPSARLTASAYSDTDIAYPVEGGNIYFNKSDGYITDADATVTAANIPATIDGVAVTSIGGYAFAECDVLASVTLPNGITEIGYCAFKKCTSLTSVTLPDSLTYIGYYAFFNCTSLASITIPESVTGIGGSAFRSCESLTGVTIPDSVTDIGSQAFAYCKSLASVTLPNGLTSIADSMFLACGVLKNVTIPDNVTEIGSYAFASCESLTNVTIPNSVTRIRDYAFYECTSLAAVTIPNGVTRVGNCAFLATEMYNNVDNWTGDFLCIGNWLIEARDSVSGDCSLPAGIVGIADSAFESCEDLTGVTIPDGVKVIGNSAFGYCDNLASVTIPGSVTVINDDAFYKCTSLTSVTIPNGVKTIGYDAFYGCESLVHVSIPESVTSIGYEAFYETALFKSVLNWTDGVLYLDHWLLCADLYLSGEYAILDGTVGIANDAFYSCANLTGVTMPDSVKYLGDGAFEYSENLTSVTISAGVTHIGDAVFYECTGLKNVTIPNGVTSIGEYAFFKCTSLTDVTIPDSVKSIGEDAFENCESLTNVTLSAGLKRIDYCAFADCTSLRRITIPASVTYIDSYAFSDSASLTDVYFCGNAPEIGEHAFQTYDEATDEYGNTPGITLFYLEGKSGWTRPTWNGYPTAIHTHSYENGKCAICGAKEPIDPTKAFVDIPHNAWYLDAVRFAVENSLMNGMGNGEFQPDEPTTRAMVVTILYRLAGSGEKCANPFADVLNNVWYTDAVAWAYQNGVVKGMTDTTFEPDTKMNREMLAVILYRYTNSVAPEKLGSTTDLSVFPDSANVSFWAKDAMQWAVANGIINGNKEGGKTYLAPQANATRAQVAAIFQRYIENVLNK